MVHWQCPQLLFSSPGPLTCESRLPFSSPGPHSLSPRRLLRSPCTPGGRGRSRQGGRWPELERWGRWPELARRGRGRSRQGRGGHGRARPWAREGALPRGCGCERGGRLGTPATRRCRRGTAEVMDEASGQRCRTMAVRRQRGDRGVAGEGGLQGSNAAEGMRGEEELKHWRYLACAAAEWD